MIELGRIGFGCVPLGGKYVTVSDADGVAAVRRAFELGVRYFDVAPLYGLGRAERLLGKGLRGLPREAYVLSTKVGRYLEDGAPVLDYSRAGTQRSLEQSFERLGIARADLVYIHDVDAHAHGSDAAAEAAFRAALAGALPALAELKRAGAVRAIGVGINEPRWAERWLREAEFDALMLAGRVTLLNREAVPGLLAECRRRGVAYVAAGAFNGGLLARGDAAMPLFNYRPASGEILAAYRGLVRLARETGAELKAAAIQFILRHEEVASLVIGAASAAEVEENLRLARAPVPEAFWSALANWKAPA